MILLLVSELSFLLTTIEISPFWNRPIEYFYVTVEVKNERQKLGCCWLELNLSLFNFYWFTQTSGAPVRCNSLAAPPDTVVSSLNRPFQNWVPHNDLVGLTDRPLKVLKYNSKIIVSLAKKVDDRMRQKVLSDIKLTYL